MARVGDRGMVRDRSTVRGGAAAAAVAIGLLLIGAACGNRHGDAARVLGARVERGEPVGGTVPPASADGVGEPAGPQAPIGTAVLTGTVTRRGDRVAGARLTLNGPSGPLRDATSDAEGRFRFDGLAAGAYDLVAVDAVDS